MINFKLTPRDKYLLTVFAVCCVLIAFMAWQISDPVVTSKGSCVYYMLCLFGG